MILLRGGRDRQRLIRLGEILRRARKRQGVSAVAAAESVGISRVTLHRIERGEPSVAIAPRDALALYERNWRHVDLAALSPDELALIDTLARTLGAGRLLV